MSLLQRVSDRAFYTFTAVLSVGALGFLAYLLLLHHGKAGSDAGLHFLPAVNASLNATSAALLVAGYVAIRRGKRRLHPYLMVAAFIFSSLFLVCYVWYHSFHGDTRFLGTGWIRPVYFTVLVSHILLSALVVPLALTSFYFAGKKTFARHKRIAKVTLPIWLYVSVTGVAIFWMLRGHS